MFSLLFMSMAAISTTRAVIKVNKIMTCLIFCLRGSSGVLIIVFIWVFDVFQCLYFTRFILTIETIHTADCGLSENVSYITPIWSHDVSGTSLRFRCFSK